jgi:hypothetical protein
LTRTETELILVRRGCKGDPLRLIIAIMIDEHIQLVME